TSARSSAADATLAAAITAATMPTTVLRLAPSNAGRIDLSLMIPRRLVRGDYSGGMKPVSLPLAFALTCAVSVFAAEPAGSYDPALAKRLGADERGMKTYVLCIL